jgi:hypothetical protein
VARVAAPLVVAAAIVVLAIGAVSQIGPASGPDRRTVDRSFAALAGPIVARSNASGAALNTLLGDGPSLLRVAFFSDLDSLTSATADDDRQFAALTPPEPANDAASRCATAMDDRRRGTAGVASALEGLLGGRRGLGGGDEAAAAHGLATAGTLLASADAFWASCRRTLHRAPGSARLPASVWVTDPGVWSEGSLGRFVAALVSSASLTTAHGLALLSVSTDPASVPGASGVSVLPPTSALRVLIVLADQGNVDEAGVTVVLTAVPQGTARAPAPVRARTDVAAGHSVTLTPPPLDVRPGRGYVIDITATAQAGASVSASLPVRVSLVPPPPTTTTTTTSATSSTVHSG